MKSLRYFIDLVEGKIEEANWWPSKEESKPTSFSPGIVTTQAKTTNSTPITSKKESSAAVEEMIKAADSIRRRQNLDLSIDAIEYYATMLKNMAVKDKMTSFIPMLEKIINDPENVSNVDIFVKNFNTLIDTTK